MTILLTLLRLIPISVVTLSGLPHVWAAVDDYESITTIEDSTSSSSSLLDRSAQLWTLSGIIPSHDPYINDIGNSGDTEIIHLIRRNRWKYYRLIFSELAPTEYGCECNAACRDGNIEMYLTDEADLSGADSGGWSGWDAEGVIPNSRAQTASANGLLDSCTVGIHAPGNRATECVLKCVETNTSTT